MTQEQLLKNLTVPKGKIDVVLDTDACNEIDDQFAISYMLHSEEKLNVLGICAAPFKNARSKSPADGMEKSYNEIVTLLKFDGKESFVDNVYKGSTEYLKDEKTPVISDAAKFMAKLADSYSSEKPLYIVAIGAITNVASAMLINPKMAENTVIVWLGGHSLETPYGACEFNMVQDIAAARVIMGCGVPFVQLPCQGVASCFTTTKPELEFWLRGKNKLCDYLIDSAIAEAESYAKGKPWSRVIWDVTAVAWLLNDNSKFMLERLCPSPIPEYDKHYATNPNRHFIKYVYSIRRDALFEDLFNKLTK